MPEWHQVVDDLAEPSEIEVEQDGRRALLRTAPGPTTDAFAEPSVSPRRRYSKDSHALQQRPDAPKRWCLNPNGMSIALFHNDIFDTGGKVGPDSV
jgi:hypothetical protein